MIIEDISETTQVFPATAADADSFLDVREVEDRFALLQLPDGSYALPNGIMDSGIPPNSMASQEESPLVDGLDEIDWKNPTTWVYVGGGLVVAYVLYRMFRD